MGSNGVREPYSSLLVMGNFCLASSTPPGETFPGCPGSGQKQLWPPSLRWKSRSPRQAASGTVSLCLALHRRANTRPVPNLQPLRLVPGSPGAGRPVFLCRVSECPRCARCCQTLGTGLRLTSENPEEALLSAFHR